MTLITTFLLMTTQVYAGTCSIQACGCTPKGATNGGDCDYPAPGNCVYTCDQYCTGSKPQGSGC